MVLSLSSCSDDDEVFVTSEQIIGTWDVIWAEQDGESIDIPKGYIYMKRNHSIFRHDNFIGCFSADKIKMSARK